MTYPQILPGIVTGYALNPCREWVSVILPRATTNLFTNPSFEVDTAGWALAFANGSGGTPFGRNTLYQFRGAYAAQLQIRPTGGTTTQIATTANVLASGTTYSLSIHVRTPSGAQPYRSLDVAIVPAPYWFETGGAGRAFSSAAAVADGWWRYTVTFTASADTGIGIGVSGAAGEAIYLDALQLEATDESTTYCDGDEAGLLPLETPGAYRWNGPPHASTSSRSATTRAGGVVRRLDEFGFTLTSISGLEAPPVTNVATPLGVNDGSVYQTTIRPSRPFALGGRLAGAGRIELGQARGALIAALAADRSGQPQPVRLIVQLHDGLRAIGDAVRIDASYAGGLEGSDNNLYAEDVAISFEAWQPYLVSLASRGADTAARTLVGTAFDGFVERLPTGAYRIPPTLDPGGNPVNAVAYSRSEIAYVGFLLPGPANYIAAWNGTAWAALGTGLNGTPRAIVEDNAGNIYAGGDFTSAGGVASTAYIARWNGAAWQSVGGGMNGAVYALAVDRFGFIYAAGNFTSAGGVASVGIAVWNGASWAALPSFATGLTGGGGRALLYDPAAELLYVGGTFTGAAGVAGTARIARYRPASDTWTAMGGGANNTVSALAQGLDGTVFAGGSFTTIGGIAASRLAAWNGSQWRALGAGTTNPVTALVVDPDTGQLVTNQASVWNGTALVPQDYYNLGGGVTLARSPSSRYGFAVNPGDVYAAATVSIGGRATAPTPYGVRVIQVSGTSVGLILVGVGQTQSYYQGLTLAAGEQAVIRGDLGGVVQSTLRRQVANVPDAGSNPDAFLMTSLDGAVVAILASSVPGNGLVSLWAQPRFLSLDDTVARL